MVGVREAKKYVAAIIKGGEEKKAGKRACPLCGMGYDMASMVA